MGARGLPERYFIRQNDTAPAIRSYLTDLTGTVLPNLGTATVKFVMDKTGFGAMTASIEDANTGEVKYAWQAGDTDTAGTFRAYWQVTFADATVQTIPADIPIDIIIEPDLEA